MHPIRFVATRLIHDLRGFFAVSKYKGDSWWYPTLAEARSALAAKRAEFPDLPLNFQITDTLTGSVYTDLQPSKSRPLSAKAGEAAEIEERQL